MKVFRFWVVSRLKPEAVVICSILHKHNSHFGVIVLKVKMPCGVCLALDLIAFKSLASHLYLLFLIEIMIWLTFFFSFAVVVIQLSILQPKLCVRIFFFPFARCANSCIPIDFGRSCGIYVAKKRANFFLLCFHHHWIGSVFLSSSSSIL